MGNMAKFNIGDIVLHNRFGYRAVVVDVDPLFQASGHFNPQALKRDFAKRNPWYRLLLDRSSQMTYVEECMLILDNDQNPVDNPKVNHYLKKQKGVYRRITRGH